MTRLAPIRSNILALKYGDLAVPALSIRNVTNYMRYSPNITANIVIRIKQETRENLGIDD